MGKKRKRVFRRRRVSLRKRRQELVEKGEKFSRKEILLCYGIVLIISILLGVGLKLKIGCLLVATFLCAVQVPGLYFNLKKRMHEKKRFEDANAYMSHMAQSFTGNGKFLASLKETREIFSKGIMRNKLTKAISHIEGSYDVELSEQQAIQMIEEEYGCERIRVLHDFLLKAEARGGSCDEEFRLLETMRQLWEQTSLKYKNTITLARNLVTFEYFLLILVCMFMLHQFPVDLQILHMPMIQVLNTFLIVCFFFVFSRLDKKLSQSMLKDTRRMTDAQAKAKLNYIRDFHGKRSVIRQLPYAITEIFIVIMYFGWSQSKFVLIAGFVIFGLILFAGYIRYILTYQNIKDEIKAVFPCWLFDVLLLMQSENVSVAILKSTEKAPAILKDEIRELSLELEENPMSPEAFLTFLTEFRLPQVEGIMRKLYAIHNGTGAGKEAMNLVIDTNMTMLSEAEEQRLRLKGDLFSMYYMVPTIPVMVCMLGYGVALIFVIFKNIMTFI